MTVELRRSEPFLLPRVEDGTDGCLASWIHQACDLHDVYESGDHVDLDRGLLERMSRASSPAHGLRVDEASLAEAANADFRRPMRRDVARLVVRHARTCVSRTTTRRETRRNPWMPW